MFRGFYGLGLRVLGLEAFGLKVKVCRVIGLGVKI